MAGNYGMASWGVGVYSDQTVYDISGSTGGTYDTGRGTIDWQRMRGFGGATAFVASTPLPHMSYMAGFRVNTLGEFALDAGLKVVHQWVLSGTVEGQFDTRGKLNWLTAMKRNLTADFVLSNIFYGGSYWIDEKIGGNWTPNAESSTIWVPETDTANPWGPDNG